DFTLVAVGGAGGAHAAELAGELGLPRVYVPQHPGLLSAFGALTAETIRDFTSTLRAVDPSVPVLAGGFRRLGRLPVAAVRRQGPARRRPGRRAGVRHAGRGRAGA